MRRAPLLPAQQPVLAGGQDRHGDGEQQGERDAVGELVELERVLVDERGQRLRRAARPAAGHHPDLVEEFQPADDRQHQVDRDRRGEGRAHDVPEPGDRSGAVDLGLFQHLGRDALQPGQEDDHRIAGELPDDHADDRPDHDRPVAEEVLMPGAEAERRGEPVDRAVRGVHEFPQVRGDDRGHHGRREE